MLPIPSSEAPSVARRILPPDRAWLALLFRAGAYSFANREDPAAPADATRYDRFYTLVSSEPANYRGACNLLTTAAAADTVAVASIDN